MTTESARGAQTLFGAPLISARAERAFKSYVDPRLDVFGKKVDRDANLRREVLA